jgi:pilus assembly protein FimV
VNKKALSLAITLAMAFPTVSHALGLGDIQSNSHLNQPFRGKIPVLSASPSEVKSMRIRIASPEVFNRVGIDRPAFLNSIRFRPTVENGRPVILVSSTQPIHEPFVNFLLEVNWSKGQLLKEYTALLDPPVLMQPGTAVANNRAGVRPEPGYQGRVSRPAAQQQARRQQQRRIVRAPARRPAIRRAAPNRHVAAAPARSRTYRVRGGDTLFKVAKKLGYRGIRTEQMMMALFEANPSAFHRKNVNILKKGALMKRPPIQHAKSISYRAAKRQLASQTAAWKKYRSELAAKSGKSGKSSRVASNNQSARSKALDNAGKGSDYQFKVSGSKGGVVTDSKVSGNASVAELKKQLTMASESLASRTNENAELKSRVAELESLLRKKNRLITIKSEQLSELQARLGGADAPKAAVTGGTETAVVDPIDEGTEIAGIVDNQPGNEAGQVVRTAPTTPEPVEEPVENVEPPQVEPQSVAPVTAASQGDDEGILGMLADPTLIAGGLGAGGLLLGGLWFMKRRKEKDDFSDEELADFDLDHDMSEDSAFTADLGSDNRAERNTLSDEFTTADFGEDKMFADSTPKTVDPDMSSEGESKEENILQEADVYLVYGLHDQAESELRKAIDEEPDNLAYRAKLIENFKAAGNKEAFEKEARIFSEMEGADKDKYWEQITEWGKTLIPENNLFSGKAQTASQKADADEGKSGVAGLADGAAAAAAGLAVTAGKASPDLDADATQFNEDLENAFDNDGLEDLNLDAVLGDETDNIESGLLDAKDDLISDIETGVDVDSSDAGDMDLASFDLDSNTDMEFVTDVAASEVSEDAGEKLADLNVDEFNFDEKQDDKLTAASDDLTDTVADNSLEMPNLNLDIDANDFDKLMPEDHAYKKVEAEQASADEDNLLADFDDNLSFLDLEDNGEVIEETQISTKLDLAKAYIDMGDIEGARNTLEEVMQEGNDEQKRQAEELLQQTG